MNGLSDRHTDELRPAVIGSYDDVSCALPARHDRFRAAKETKQAGEVHIILCVFVGLYGGVRTGPKKLTVEGRWHVNRRDVVDIGLQSVLRE